MIPPPPPPCSATPHFFSLTFFPGKIHLLVLGKYELRIVFFLKNSFALKTVDRGWCFALLPRNEKKAWKGHFHTGINFVLPGKYHAPCDYFSAAKWCLRAFQMTRMCQRLLGWGIGSGKKDWAGGWGGGEVLMQQDHWLELPQVSFLSRQALFCRDKHSFVATKHVFCRDKKNDICGRSCHKYHFCRDKGLLASRQWYNSGA